MSKPISSHYMFHALKDKPAIILAANPRMARGVVEGIFAAAKEADAPIIFELAKSECNLGGGYTGLTPKTFSEKVLAASDKIGFDCWALHADHLTIKKGSPEEIAEVKELVSAQVKAGYTSFAIDASFLFDREGKTVEEQLAKNVAVTIEMAKFIQTAMLDQPFGLEVEVGEIGWKDEHGRILTTPEEAKAFVLALNSEGICPDALAIANGSVHGNDYDADGKLIEQLSIDIPQTTAVADALRGIGASTRIAQHGITGTPLRLIEEKFPKYDIVKGNVATHFQNLVWDVFKEKEPELFSRIHSWVIEAHKEKAGLAGMKSDEQVFGKFSKFAFKQFFEEIYSANESTFAEIEARTKEDSLKFFKAFGSAGTAELVRTELAR